MRIALNVAGQPRYCPEAIESQGRRLHFAPDDELFLFCFFWDTDPEAAAHISLKFRQCFGIRHEQTVVASSFTPHVPEAFEAHEEVKVDNVFQMHRALYECNLLRERFEQNSGQPFDLCVRTRPDLTFDSYITVADYAELYRDFILTPRNGYHRRGVNDQFCIASPAGMSAYCRVFEHIHNYLAHGIALHSELLLRTHLVAKKRKFVAGDFHSLLMKEGRFVVG